MADDNQVDNEEFCSGKALAFNRSCGLVFYRHRSDGQIEIAMQLRDDFPALGLLGGGATDPNETMFEGALREAEEETNFPARDLVNEKEHFLIGLRGVYGYTDGKVKKGDRVEDCDLWAIDIGDFPLEKKGEGVGMMWVPLNGALPTNMMAYTDQMVGHIAKCLDPEKGLKGRLETREDAKRLPLVYHGEYRNFSTAPRGTYAGLREFDAHPRVIARRQNFQDVLSGRTVTDPEAAERLKRFGMLRWDPEGAAAFMSVLEDAISGKDPGLTLKQIAQNRQLKHQ